MRLRYNIQERFEEIENDFENPIPRWKMIRIVVTEEQKPTPTKVVEYPADMDGVSP